VDRLAIALLLVAALAGAPAASLAQGLPPPVVDLDAEIYVTADGGPSSQPTYDEGEARLAAVCPFGALGPLFGFLRFPSALGGSMMLPGPASTIGVQPGTIGVQPESESRR
jgi:hypothetical protein